MRVRELFEAKSSLYDLAVEYCQWTGNYHDIEDVEKKVKLGIAKVIRPALDLPSSAKSYWSVQARKRKAAVDKMIDAESEAGKKLQAKIEARSKNVLRFATRLDTYWVMEKEETEAFADVEAAVKRIFGEDAKVSCDIDTSGSFNCYHFDVEFKHKSQNVTESEVIDKQDQVYELIDKVREEQEKSQEKLHAKGMTHSGLQFSIEMYVNKQGAVSIQVERGQVSMKPLLSLAGSEELRKKIEARVGKKTAEMSEAIEAEAERLWNMAITGLQKIGKVTFEKSREPVDVRKVPAVSTRILAKYETRL